MVKVTFLLTALLTALPAMAQVITFTISATGSGTVGTTAFSDATITFTQVTNTSAIVDPCMTYSYPCAPVATNKVTISGVGTETLSAGSYFFDNGINVAGITNAPNYTYLGGENSSLATYNMKSNFAPTAFPIYSTGVSNLSTSGGALDITWGDGDATFKAALGSSPTPEPATFGLMLTGAGLLGLLMVTRKR